MVIGPADEAELEAMLAPYDETRTVAPYESPIGEWTLNQRNEGESDEDLARRLTEEWGEDVFVNDEGVLVSMSTYNPDSKWDWWVVGGRWRGSLPLKPNAEGDLGDLSWVHDGVDNRMYEGGVDVARLGDIDFDFKRLKAGEIAAATWDKANEIRDGREIPPVPPVGSEREDYQRWWADPVVADLKQFVGMMGAPDDIVELCGDRETYIERARAAAVPAFATLTSRGWLEPGRMGWWGISTDDTESRDRYYEKVNSILASLPPETMVWVVDVHI
jgi:hypothetical protein